MEKLLLYLLQKDSTIGREKSHSGCLVGWFLETSLSRLLKNRSTIHSRKLVGVLIR